MNAYQSRYLRVWERAFAELLGWDRDETLRWAKRFLEHMDPPGVWITENPFFYVANDLVYRQQYCDELTPRRREELIRAVQHALEGGGDGNEIPEGYDGATVRAEVGRILLRVADSGQGESVNQ
ncbi:MAG TPA: hypothetical protein VMV72_00395 [Verrucomicrobiae bacterium]|nr:hypothetical protein [Verrucomicrobiae bacterium]